MKTKWFDPRTWGSKTSKWGIPLLDMIAAGQNGEVSDFSFSKAARKGYLDTDIVFAGVDLIASSTASVPKRAMRRVADGKSEPLEDSHPLNKLIKRPNPLQKENDFMYAQTAFRLLGGQSFTWMNTGFTDPLDSSALPLEMWAMNPETATMRARDGLFYFQVDQQYSDECCGPRIAQRQFPVDVMTGQANLLQWQTFNPLSMCKGVSPLQAANTAIDIYRAGNIWNRGYFKNGCRPSTALVSDTAIPDKQYERMKKEIVELYSGLQNGNGKPLLLEMTKPMELSKSPKDADFAGSHDQAAKDIFRDLRIPPILLGIGQDNTFANVDAAEEWYWSNVAIPINDDYIAELNLNLVPRFRDPSIFIEADYSKIAALEGMRERMWQRAEKSTTMTLNEKREMQGMSPVDGGDVILVPSGYIPLELANLTLPE